VSDTATTATTEQTEEKVDTTTETPGAESTTDSEPQGEDLESLPEWARKRLTKANTEAARYRTSLRETEAKLAGAKTPEELDAAVAQVKDANAKLEQELLVERTARKFGLPDDLAARLRGTTEEELAADAKLLQKYAAPEMQSPESLSGGLDPNEDEAFDPVKAAQAARRSRY